MSQEIITVKQLRELKVKVPKHIPDNYFVYKHQVRVVNKGKKLNKDTITVKIFAFVKGRFMSPN